MKRKILSAAAALLALVFSFGIWAGCSDDITEDGKEPPVASSLVFSPNSLTVAIGESVPTQLHGLAEGEEVASYTSNNTGVAAVDAEGNVTGVAAGNAVIKAVTGNGNVALAAVEVYDRMQVSVPVIEMNGEGLLLQTGDTYTLAASVTLGGQKVEADIAWESDDPSVVAVSRGVVTAVGEGKATITASATYNGETAVAKRQVTVLPASLSVCPDYEGRAVYRGDRFPLQVSATYNGVQFTVDASYTSSDPEVAYVLQEEDSWTLVASSGGDTVIKAVFRHNGEEYTVATPLHVYGAHTVSIYALGYGATSRDSLLTGKLYGERITLSLKDPVAGRDIKCWYVDGVKIEGNTFIMPDSNVVAYAKYVNETEGDFTVGMSDGSLFGASQAAAEYVVGTLADSSGSTNTDGDYVKLTASGRGASTTFTFDESVVVTEDASATVRMYVPRGVSVYFGHGSTRRFLYAENAIASSESLKKMNIAVGQWIEVVFPLNDFVSNGQLLSDIAIGVSGGEVLLDYIMLKY